MSAYTGLPGDPVGPPGAVAAASVSMAAAAAASLRPVSARAAPPPEPGVSGMLLPAQGPQQ
ncbi:hypothetical protein MAHJHV28_47270 [Mycobacterium avium subsp. hominissuis]